VWALGVVLYELLTERLPFQGPTPYATLLAIQTQKPVPPGKINWWVPEGLQAICLRCLEKAPADRYPTAEALAEDLERFSRGEPIHRQGRNGKPFIRLRRALRRLPPRARAVVVLGAVLCAGVLVFAFSSKGETISIVGTHRSDLGGAPGGMSVSVQQFDRAVGFKYRSWRVLGIDVWTWGGGVPFGPVAGEEGGGEPTAFRVLAKRNSLPC
jgi:serine/threonine protein kinase